MKVPSHSTVITIRLKNGSPLARYMEKSTAKNATEKLHELAAAHEAVMSVVQRN